MKGFALIELIVVLALCLCLVGGLGFGIYACTNCDAMIFEMETCKKTTMEQCKTDGLDPSQCRDLVCLKCGTYCGL